MEKIVYTVDQPPSIGSTKVIIKKSIEERLADLEACCKENKIFIFKLMTKISNKEFTPYELSFLLNNLDFFISNRENIIETLDYKDDILNNLWHYIRYYEKTETFIDELGEEKLEKILLHIINNAYKGDIDTFENQLEHPQIKVVRKKTYDILKKIIKKIRETFIKKIDGKRRSKSKRRSKKRSKKRSKRKM